MNFINTILLIGILTVTANAQNNSINVTDKKGFKQGKWKKLYRHGVIAYEGQFKDNIE